MDGLIDLNADAGEDCGDDAALFATVTSANIAAGGHAGGGDVLEQAMRRASRAGVQVGAHPSYPDRAAFGRVSRADVHDAASIATFVHDQTLVVATAASSHAMGIAHVKAHGALYNDAARSEAIAEALVDGILRAARDLGTGLAAIGMPGSALEPVCARHRVDFVAEAYADRAYAPDGSLVPRSHPGAVIDDPEAVVRQLLGIVRDGMVSTSDGAQLRIAATTVCMHGDTPGAVSTARRVRAELERSGIRVERFGSSR